MSHLCSTHFSHANNMFEQLCGFYCPTSVLNHVFKLEHNGVRIWGYVKRVQLSASVPNNNTLMYRCLFAVVSFYGKRARHDDVLYKVNWAEHVGIIEAIIMHYRHYLPSNNKWSSCVKWIKQIPSLGIMQLCTNLVIWDTATFCRHAVLSIKC